MAAGRVDKEAKEAMKRNITTNGTDPDAEVRDVPESVRNEKFEKGGTTSGGQGDRYAAGPSQSLREEEKPEGDTPGGTAPRPAASGHPASEDASIGGDTSATTQKSA